MKRLIAAGIACLIPAGAALAQGAVAHRGVAGQGWHRRHPRRGLRRRAVGRYRLDPGAATNKDTDKNNPDPALRDRPVMGLPILINMQPSEGRWEGSVYNAENGKTYDSSISLVSPDVLAIQGCVLGFLCGGEEWTRQPLPKGAPSDKAVCAKLVK